MLTIRLTFAGRGPVDFTGTLSECALQLENARLHEGFNGYDILSMGE